LMFTLPAIGNVQVSPAYLEVGAIIFLLFILVLSLAQLRRHFVDWSFKGAVFGLFFGFLFAFVLEGFLIIGGKTAITGVLGWKNATKPILAVLDLGKEKLVQVLGVQDEIPVSSAKTISGTTLLKAKDVINFFQSLSPSEVEKARKIICQ